MKRVVCTFAVFVAFGLGAAGMAVAQSSNTEGAKKKVTETLPATPPQESSGTVKSPTLQPNDGKKREPKYKEVPPPPKPKKEKKETKKD
jgi:hypothetical protein